MFRVFFVPAVVSVLMGCSGGGSSGGSVTPTQVNVAPVIAIANPDQSAEIGASFSYDAAQNGTTFTDANSDTLSYNITLSPNDSGLTASGTVISGTPTKSGTVQVALTASDPCGLYATDQFLITVNTATQGNILLIISDDIGKDSSAQYSLTTDLPTTPILDGLASDGIVFENFWVNPTCSPTRASILTGKYGSRTGVLEPQDTLSLTETILHEVIASTTATNNYAMAKFGKWHLGGGRTAPNDAGIPHFEGITGGGVDDYYNWDIVVNGTSSDTTNYATTELTDRAINWIGNQTSPWFVWMAYNAAHTPFHAPPSNLHTRSLSGDPNDSRRDHYLAAIEAMDTEIGRLLNSLDAVTRAKTTILCMGDNGTPNGVRITQVYPKGTKGTVTEGGINVPLIVTGNSVAAARAVTRNAELINGVDMFETILTLAGASGFDPQDSKAFSRFFAEMTTTEVHRTAIFSEDLDEMAVRDGQYKLVENKTTGARELYDLTNDPTEANNLLNGNTDVSAIVDALVAARTDLLD